MSSTEATRGGAATALDRSHAPGPGPLRPYDFPPVTRFRLQNGLPVVFARTRGLPVVTFSVLLRAGGLQQGEQRGGLATLTSGLLDSGAGDRSGAEIAEAVEGLGVSLSSASGWDTAQVEATGLRAHADATLDIVSDLLSRATFPESEVERLRAEQL
ncbi:MAG TPA: insulinase family protein, partial [Longimicrobiaceae bacterium]|nr:insulinase family protein [Longimicrobiaceae bacterium]